MRRVLFINRSYWPDAEATGQLLTELCEDLTPGFDVTVLCGQPNHNTQGTPFRHVGRQVHNGVTVWRVPHTRFSKAWRQRWRAINMLTFLLSATLIALFCRRPEVVVVETDPPLLCMLGYLVKRLRRSELIVYLQDIYPDVAAAMGQLPAWFPLNLARRIFHGIYCRADRVVVLSEDMQQFLIDSGVRAEKISVIPNWVDTQTIRPMKIANVFREQHGLNGRFVVMYSGNMGLSQRLHIVLQTAADLRHRDDVVFVFVGDGATRNTLESLATEMKLTNVRFLDYQPKTDLAQSLSAADLQLVPLYPPLAKYLMPSKLYSALAAGCFIVAITDPSCELSRIVDEEAVGVVISPENAAALTRTIIDYAEMPDAIDLVSHRSRQVAIGRFDRQLSVNSFKELLGSDVCRSVDTTQRRLVMHPVTTISAQE